MIGKYSWVLEIASPLRINVYALNCGELLNRREALLHASRIIRRNCDSDRAYKIHLYIVDRDYKTGKILAYHLPAEYKNEKGTYRLEKQKE